MQVLEAVDLETLLARYGFEEWSVRLDGRRFRCPHGLLIGLADECLVGCVSPLVILGLVSLNPDFAANG